jgi:hypothetical protein
MLMLMIIIIVLIVLSIIAGLVYKSKAEEAAELEAAELETEELEAAELEAELEAEAAEEAAAALPFSFKGKHLNSLSNTSQCLYMQNNKKAKIGQCKYAEEDKGPYSLHLNGTLRSHDLMKKGVDKCTRDDAWISDCNPSDKESVLWDYNEETKQLKNKKNNKCLTTNNKMWNDVYLNECDDSLKNQQWGIIN